MASSALPLLDEAPSVVTLGVDLTETQQASLTGSLRYRDRKDGLAIVQSRTAPEWGRPAYPQRSLTVNLVDPSNPFTIVGPDAPQEPDRGE